MKIATIFMTALAGLDLATAAAAAPPDIQSLEQRQTCAIPNVGCYGQRDCCGGLKCNFRQSCCNRDDDGSRGKAKIQRCGCCVK
ncbi:hypothetical protein MY8738_009378 [Beauveria namnaoensis]